MEIVWLDQFFIANELQLRNVEIDYEFNEWLDFSQFFLYLNKNK